MNFLAHMQLSCSDDYLMVGNFFADLLNLKGTQNLPTEFHRGVELHRLIDSFTDNHESVKSVNKLLHADHHKYAPVVSDVIFDYFLAKNWKTYDHRDLNSFCQFVYVVLKTHLHLLNDKHQKMVNSMINDNFLMKYTSLEGMEFVFNKMSKRSRYTSNFPKAVDNIVEFNDEINHHFNLFYPDLIKEVNTFCHC
ncbi:MAG: DUF479 domain-containing protein [Saprospiraceae bacterium]|nr:DUF479 domain-containing protein [Saprospiraceae bacterium]